MNAAHQQRSPSSLWSSSPTADTRGAASQVGLRAISPSGNTDNTSSSLFSGGCQHFDSLKAGKMQKLNVLFAPAVHGTTPYSAFGHPTWKAFFHACLMVVQHNCYDSSRSAMPHPIHACSTSQQVLNFAYYQPIVAIHQMPSGVLPYYNKMVLVFVQF